jgi:O-antigen/teichoic acid export membrane protein
VSADSVAPRAGGAAVFRHAALFVGAQALVAPLAAVTSLLVVRSLGPSELGLQYLAGTFVGFTAQAAEWGQGAALTASVAREPQGAGAWLGAGLSGRLLGTALALPAMLLALALLRDEPGLVPAALLALGAAALGLASAACADVLRGLERADLAASSWVALQLVASGAALAVVGFGGRLHALLATQLGVQGLALASSLWTLERLGVRPARPSFARVGALARAGTPFVAFGLVIAAQSNVEAFFLARYASPEVVGWFGAARRVLGPLLVPAGALVSALYPALCRLSGEPHEVLRVTRGAVASVALVAMPAALGCALFAELPTLLLGRVSFAGAEPVIRAFGPLVFLLYVTMPIGACLTATGKQRAWTLVQAGSLLVSLVAYPLLVPLTDQRFHNGGLGAAGAALLNELATLGGALYLAPRGLVERTLLARLAAVALSGAAMALSGLAARPLGPFAAAAVALGAYLLAALVTGALGAGERAALRGLVSRRR